VTRHELLFNKPAFKYAKGKGRGKTTYTFSVMLR